MICPVAESRLRALLKFAEARTPGAMAEYPPVPQAEIEALLDTCPRHVVPALPRAALEVIAWLGGSESNIVSVFGATYTTSIARMLDEIEEQLLAERFFRVAVSRDLEQMVEGDLYVDLSRSDGEDAPLVVLVEEWRGEVPATRGHTILSKALQRIFHGFELHKRGFVGYLAEGYHPKDRTRWQAYADAMATLATRMGLTELLPLRPDLRCYSSPHVALMFDAMGVDLRTPDGYIQVWIGADSRQDFLNYAAQIRSAMPPLPILDEWRIP